MSDALSLTKSCYEKIQSKYAEAKAHFGRPLTLTEKILAGHMKKVCDENGKQLERCKSYADFYPDRVALQDATAQMAILQFMTAGQKRVFVPTTVHCDHLIRAEKGADFDLSNAKTENKEVYAFLRSACEKYGMGFWKPGSGIIHQVVLENYAFPGGMMLGTDSHTPNAGGLGMIAIGVGGADAVDVMTSEPFNLRWPGVIGVKLTGKLNGWASPKDVILKLMGILTVKGGTGRIVEFFGDGCASISATGKGTIANMGAEHGATTSVFAYDQPMKDYLKATNRGTWAELADQFASFLRADDEVYAEPEKFYDRVVHIDLDTLQPHIVGPHSPDLSRPIADVKAAVASEKYPDDLKAALIGSCTNSSYEDIDRAASIAKAATELGLKAKIPFMVTPGSESVFATIKRDGQMKALEAMGGMVLANACGPCIGQWKRHDVQKGETNSILSSYNRNFPGRNDGSKTTLSFLASPEIVTAIALSGKLSFNPLIDELETASGEKVRLPVPTGNALPKNGIKLDFSGFVEPLADGSSVSVSIDPDSERLAFLKPFPKWSGRDFVGMPILLKAKGKCTTDHISPAGPWLTYRGHLDKIANNTYSGAINAYTGEAGFGIDATDTTLPAETFPQIARRWKAERLDWAVIGDENFGEGSSREHAAMQPRHLGCKVIITRSFARIHETNLKKHGILPLTFANPADYDKIQMDDRLDVVGLADLEAGVPVKVVLHHAKGGAETIECRHTFSPEQIKWFKAGSALNYLGEREAR
jgi:aconitate hydratase